MVDPAYDPGLDALLIDLAVAILAHQLAQAALRLDAFTTLQAAMSKS